MCVWGRDKCLWLCNLLDQFLKHVSNLYFCQEIIHCCDLMWLYHWATVPLWERIKLFIKLYSSETRNLICGKCVLGVCWWFLFIYFSVLEKPTHSFSPVTLTGQSSRQKYPQENQWIQDGECNHTFKNTSFFTCNEPLKREEPQSCGYIHHLDFFVLHQDTFRSVIQKSITQLSCHTSLKDISYL